MDEIRRARLNRLQSTQPAKKPEKPPQQPQQPQISNPTQQPSPQAPKVVPKARTWAHQMLDRIFELQALELDLKSPGFDDLDTILWEAITRLDRKLDFLSASYDRLRTAIRTQKNKDPLVAIEPVLCSYAVICATSDSSELCYENLSAWILTSSVNWQFLSLVVDSALQQDLINELLDPVWASFRQNLLSNALNGSYAKILAATDSLLANKQVASLVGSSPIFPVKEGYEPAEIVQQTWLGPFLSLSPLDGSFPLSIFSGIDDFSFNNPVAAQRIENTMPEVNNIMELLFSICDKLVRSSPDTRQLLLNYFARVLDKNHKRMASFHVDPKAINSDGFMANVTYITVKFCLPFMDFTGAKLEKIDPSYYLYEHSYNIEEETKVVAGLEESKETLAAKTLVAPNFITQIFFLAVGFMHYGLAGIYQSETRLKRASRHAQSQADQVQAAIARLGDTPYARSILQKARTQWDSIRSTHLALSSVIRNQQLMSNFYDFSGFIEFWTLHQAQPSYPLNPLRFDQNGEASKLFRSYPEHLIESYVATMVFVGQALPQIARNSSSPIVDGLIFYMECPEFIKNPYLKSQMVDVLFYGSIPQQAYVSGEIPGYFVDHFNTNELCQKHLFHALMKIYVDMELTGRSAQFYEKFHTREAISRIMRVLWLNPVYQTRLEQESIHNEEFFVKFTALLLNDSTYMLDEALGKLQEIHRLQEEIKNNPDAARVQEQSQDNEQEENEENQTPLQQLSTAEDRAKQYLDLSKGCIELLSTFTSKVPGPFIRPEVVDRLVSMLDYNLNALVGPKCSELKVDNPEKYGFNPRGLLSTILRVYLNLEPFDDFIQAIARDSESFGISIFTRAAGITGKHSIVSPQEQAGLKNMLDKVEAAIQENEDDEEELGEIPDEYLDPLMYTLMKEPVILPSSGTTIDLTTIKSYLLNSPTDPFNRTPLKIEDVIPSVELKKKIEEFKRNAKNQRET